MWHSWCPRPRRRRRRLAEQQGRRSLNRLGDGELIEMSNHTLRYLSTDLLSKQVTPILCEYRARTLEEFGDFMHHAGEEFLFVLEGAVELHTEYYAPVILKAGESIYFDSRMGHAYLAHGPGVCRALSINVTPQEEMRKVHDVAAARARPASPPAPSRSAPLQRPNSAAAAPPEGGFPRGAAFNAYLQSIPDARIKFHKWNKFSMCNSAGKTRL